jgi:prepilin peptidase CpaA
MLAASSLELELPIAAAATALVWAAVSDIRHYIIPNRTVAIVGGAFALFACSMPWSFAIGGVLAGLIVFSIALTFFARGWMGGGDAKLMTAVALWAGSSCLSTFALVTSLAGAALGLVMLTPAWRIMPTPSAEALGLARQPMPFGLPIAAGGLAILAHYLLQPW